MPDHRPGADWARIHGTEILDPDGHLWTADTACGTCRWLGKGEGGARHVHTPGHAWWPANRWQRLLATLRGNQRPILAAAIAEAGPNRTRPRDNDPVEHENGDSPHQWRKATASHINGCVETAPLPSGGVAIRNSRDPEGPVLRYTATEWAAFTAGIKAGEFDHLTD